MMSNDGETTQETTQFAIWRCEVLLGVLAGLGFGIVPQSPSENHATV
jgi:hypothetical protein